MQHPHLETLFYKKHRVLEGGPTIKRPLTHISPQLSKLRDQIKREHDEHTKRLLDQDAEPRN